MSIVDGLPRSLGEAELAVERSVASGPSRRDLSAAQREEWGVRHRLLVARLEALRSAEGVAA